MIRSHSAPSLTAMVALVTVLLLASAATTGAQQTDAAARKSPHLALALSVLVPGAGQLYNGDHLKAVGMFGGAVLTIGPLLLTTSDVLGLDDDTSGTGTHILGAAGLGILLWSWIDAPLSARAINRRLDGGGMAVAVDVGPRIHGASTETGIAVSLLRIGF